MNTRKTGQGTSAWHAWPASMLENDKQCDKAVHPSVWSDPRFVYQGLPSPWSIKEMGGPQTSGQQASTSSQHL